MSDQPTKKQLMKLYGAMLDAHGHRNWWPGDTPFEICVGAILTQNCAWKNVEKAIANLKRNRLLTVTALAKADPQTVEPLVRPAGYFRQKTKKLIAFAEHIHRHYKRSLPLFFNRPTVLVREELLSLYGVGPETCDSMLLYAGGHPVFVIDAYTIRILSRHGVVEPGADYHRVQELFHDALGADAALFNDFHAQFVAVGARCCKRTNPLCEQCPVRDWMKTKSC